MKKIWCKLVEMGLVINTRGAGLGGQGVCQVFGLRYAIRVDLKNNE